MAGGTSFMGMQQGNKASKKAQSANEERRRQIIGLLRMQGETSKASIGESANNERGDISQGLIGRGLYNTTTLDTMLNMSRSREAMNKAKVDTDIASDQAETMSDWQDVAGSGGDNGQGLQIAGQLLGSLAGGMGGLGGLGAAGAQMAASGLGGRSSAPPGAFVRPTIGARSSSLFADAGGFGNRRPAGPYLRLPSRSSLFGGDSMF